jgi:hypothetical protein
MSVLLALALVYSVRGALTQRTTARSAVRAANASIVKDQTTCTTAPAGKTGVAGATWKAQTFVPAVSGRLTHVQLPGVNNGGATTLHIRDTSAGAPAGADLGSATIRCGDTFDFGAGVQLQAGHLYALVLSNAIGGYDWSYSSSATCYPNAQGHPFTSLNGGATWSADIVDFYFTTYMIPDTPGGTPATPPPICGANPGPALTQPTVFVVVFPAPGFTPIADPQLLTQEVIAQLKEATMYHGYANPDAQPYAEFQIYGGSVVQHPGLPPRRPAPDENAYDYKWIYDYYNLCSLIDNGEVDEVWFWDAGQGGFDEYVTIGPEGRWSSGGPPVNPPNCGREVTTMTFNYTRAVNLHAYGHRLEGLFMHYFPCDFWTATWPWTGAPAGCAGLVSDSSGYVGRPFAGNDHVGVCGDIHHPPNIIDGREYDYDDPATAQSICPDWQQDGTANASTISCASWNCAEARYMIWWMQNLPGLDNTNRDRDGNPQPNWWTYLFGRPSAASTPTPSATMTPGATATAATTATATATATPVPTPTAGTDDQPHHHYLPLIVAPA